MILSIEKITKYFGGIRALYNVDFTINEGEIKGLIGPNGAGKTTLFNIITGIYQPDKGAIFYYHQRIDGLPTNEIISLGLSRTYQNIRLFPNMTLLENVMLGRYIKTNAGIIKSLLRDRTFYEEEKKIVEKAKEYLSFVGLLHLGNELAKNMPYGYLRKVELARSLSSEPKLLLLDEPTAGMNPKESFEIVDLIKKINNIGVTILLIEHRMQMVMSICQKIVVLDYGEKIAEGTPEEVKNNPKVIEAYLGYYT